MTLAWDTDGHAYQHSAADHLVTRAAAALWLSPGYGKTAAALHAFKKLKDAGKARNMLVVAPLRVVQTVWENEIASWSSLEGLHATKLHGPKKAIWLKQRDVNVWLINYEGLPWLTCGSLEVKNAPHFDVVVFDEIRRLKNSQSQRFRAALPLARKATWRWGLTGTPASNGLMDLFGQFLILDGGAALGSRLTRFRRAYFEQGYDGFSWLPRPGAAKTIEDKLAPLVFRAEGKLDLPVFVHDKRSVVLDDKARKIYTTMKGDLITRLGSTVITAANAAVLVGKLKQMANGRVYDEAREVHVIHSAKQDALRELIDELGDEQLLIAYEFNHDLAQIREVLGDDVPYIGGGVGETAMQDRVAAWNRREIQFLAAHPACLHPDTSVLTEHRGWVRIVDVLDHERVFDGVEFVSHRGCQLSGRREVIERFGIAMTPDHLFLINDKWVKAEDVRDTAEGRKEARYAYAGDDSRVGALFALRSGEREAGTECGSGQSGKAEILPGLSSRDIPHDDAYPPLQDMAGDARQSGESKFPGLGALRRAGHCSSPGMVRFYEVLDRHGSRLHGTPDAGKGRCERPLLQSELPVGYEHGAAGQQTEQSRGHLQGPANAPVRVLPESRSDTGGDNTVSQEARIGGSCDDGLPSVRLSSRAKIPVYDLVDCGPRSRFVVQNAVGEVFVVHNSAGHGINLQRGGAHHILWWGPTFDLDHYIQFNDRLCRQGNTADSVVVHVFVAEHTVDETAVKSRDEKDTLQSALLKAMAVEFGDTIHVQKAEEAPMKLTFKSDVETALAEPQQGANPFQQAAPVQQGANPFQQAAAIMQDVAAPPPMRPEQAFEAFGVSLPAMPVETPPEPERVAGADLFQQVAAQEPEQGTAAFAVQDAPIKEASPAPQGMVPVYTWVPESAVSAVLAAIARAVKK